MGHLNRRKNVLIGAAFVAALVGLGVGQLLLQPTEAASESAVAVAVEAPMFEVDPLWPKPLPNHWIIGSAIGVTVDSRDHVYIVHRQGSLNQRTEVGAAQDPPTGECCVPAPPVLEFDPDGNLVGHFGGPADGYDWPESNHGITADPKDNLWIGGNGRDDAHILKFTRDGKFIAQFGKPGARKKASSGDEPAWEGNSHDKESFGRVAEVAFDPENNEAYVSDGYLNKRVAVLDMDSGELKRYWGAYGEAPSDEDLGRYNPDAPPAKQFRNPVHCAEPSNDGLIYVCDRPNDRIQVFQRDGTFVTEKFIAPKTLGDGSTWDIAFSKDPEQKYMFLADGKNMKVYVMDRKSLEILTSFGDGGRQPGQFFAVHNVATDSKGNIYTVETYEGKRVQKFVYKGLGPVDEKNQGTVWPKKPTQ
jgi:DNA-binding beta-propeller fold protein YncE